MCMRRLLFERHICVPKTSNAQTKLRSRDLFETNRDCFECFTICSKCSHDFRSFRTSHLFRSLRTCSDMFGCVWMCSDTFRRFRFISIFCKIKKIPNIFGWTAVTGGGLRPSRHPTTGGGLPLPQTPNDLAAGSASQVIEGSGGKHAHN